MPPATPPLASLAIAASLTALSPARASAEPIVARVAGAEPEAPRFARSGVQFAAAAGVARLSCDVCGSPSPGFGPAFDLSILGRGRELGVGLTLGFDRFARSNGDTLSATSVGAVVRAFLVQDARVEPWVELAIGGTSVGVSNVLADGCTLGGGPFVRGGVGADWSVSRGARLGLVASASAVGITKSTCSAAFGAADARDAGGSSGPSGLFMLGVVASLVAPTSR